jgi:tRNA A-37 threonylcarbamoyl transferase component Bud32
VFAEWLEQIIGTFEAAWQRGERPAIDDYLASTVTGRLRVLVELVHADLECRLKAGEEARVEGYLQRYPELAQDPMRMVGLIAAEYGQRRRREPDLTPAEYEQRFPEYYPDVINRLHTLIAAQEVPAHPAPAEDPGVTQMTVGPKETLPSSVSPGWPVLPGYQILGELGKGGMGVVYKARQVKLNRLIALKMILAGHHASSEVLSRFRIEAEAVARLKHPNIVQVHEVGDVEGRPFFSLEFVEGGSLADRLNGTPLPPRQAAQLVEVLARAVHEAHQRGIVHRDLKPANVLLARSDQPHAIRLEGDAPEGNTYEPKVTDFGLAKQLDIDQGQTLSGVIIGTPSYMAPEQACGRNKEIGPAADIYALGAVLYELLTGRPPFRAATPLETLEQVVRDEPVPPTRLQARTPRDLETISLKCLEKLPSRRYGSAQALAEDLGRWLAGEPILARPVRAWVRAAKWARRRPAVAGLLAVIVVIAALSFGLIFWQWQRAEGEREKAEAANRLANERTRLAKENAAIVLDQAISARRDAELELAQIQRIPQEHSAKLRLQAEVVLEKQNLAVVYRAELDRLRSLRRRSAKAVSGQEFAIAEAQAAQYEAEEQVERARLKLLQAAVDPLLELKLAEGKVLVKKIRVDQARFSVALADSSIAGDGPARLRIEEAEAVLLLEKLRLEKAKQAIASHQCKLEEGQATLERARQLAAVYRTELDRLRGLRRSNPKAVSGQEFAIAVAQATQYAQEVQVERARLKLLQASSPLLEQRLAETEVGMAENRLAKARLLAPGALPRRSSRKLARLRIEEAEGVVLLEKLRLQQAKQAVVSHQRKLDEGQATLERARQLAAVYRTELDRLRGLRRSNPKAVSGQEFAIIGAQATRYAMKEQVEQARLKLLQATDPLLEQRLAETEVGMAENRLAKARLLAPGAAAPKSSRKLARLRCEEAAIVLRRAKILLQQTEQTFAARLDEVKAQRANTQGARTELVRLEKMLSSDARSALKQAKAQVASAEADLLEARRALAKIK